MIQFSTTILKFDKKGEKSGWSYIEINAAQVEKINPGCRVSFRVKGKLDNYSFEKVALLPMGDGNFILPMNAVIRRAIRKRHSDIIKVTMELDNRSPTLSQDLVKCLKEDKDAIAYFKSLPKSHQNYFSNWIESAKTVETKTKRIAMAMNAFDKKLNFGEMIRASKKNNPY